MGGVTKSSYLSLILILFAGLSASAQEFAGYQSSNYTGVNGVFWNPATIVDSPYNWDVNLFGFGALLGNDQVALSRDEIFQWDGERIKNRFLSSDTPASGIGNLSLHGPSFMFHIGEKSAVAVFTRSRVLVNAENIDSKLADQLIGDENSQMTFPYSISSSQNMRVNLNAFTEFGLSYSRVIFSQKRSTLGAGVTLKFLNGTGNGHIHINGLSTTIKKDKGRRDSYITNTNGSLALGLGGVNLSDFEAKDLLDFNSTGFGADIGFIYEYRTHPNETNPGLNKYTLKVGVALVDLGSIKYKRDTDRSGGYDIHIPSGQRFYLSTLSNSDIDHIKETLDQYPQYFTENDEAKSVNYKVSLPTALHLAVDYHIQNNFYVNMSSRTALTSLNNKASNPRYSNYIMITPRYESNHLDFFVPVTYSSLTELNAGIAFRLGPLYLGSGSILTAAFGNTKRADVFVGLHFGGLRK